MHKVFITTNNVNKCAEMCEEMQDPSSLIGPSLATISGHAGRGKTEFARYFATNSSAIYIPPMNERSSLDVLKDITFELAKVKPGRKSLCFDVIATEMARDRRLILIDEADLLEIRTLEMLRNINERYACPVILIGEEGLKRKVLSRRRIASRIRRHVDFSPVIQPDVALFYRKALGVEISPAITGILHKQCAGDWRPLLVTAIAIERALHASGLTEITENLAKDIVGNNGNGT